LLVVSARPTGNTPPNRRIGDRQALAATKGILWRSLLAASDTAVIQQHGEWWIGWVEELPGVNSQGQSRVELLENLRDALEEALEMNRASARAAANGAYEEVSIPT
jgi:predicted RNase H-like HicB family nuclease